MEKLTAQDQQKILSCLQAGPLTVADISQRIRLSIPRVNLLIQNLRERGAVHSARCTKGSRGSPVSLWELRTPPFEPPE